MNDVQINGRLDEISEDLMNENLRDEEHKALLSEQKELFRILQERHPEVAQLQQARRARIAARIAEKRARGEEIRLPR
jgi:hypothetical protein